MGIVKKENISIAELLQDTKLHLPDYQRPYKWTVKNITQLLDDIQSFSASVSYRIGTIVIHEDEDNSHNIVDGQQRVLTFLLILKAIMTTRYSSLNEPCLKGDLETITSNMFAPEFDSEISIKNIQANYREIHRRISAMDEHILDFYLHKCHVTKIIIDDISEAFQFFDSQNARGKDLEPHDLLKAYHLRELDSTEEHQKTVLVAAWEDMNTTELARLFSEFLYRVKGWSGGYSSRLFTKKDVPMFKGVNLTSSEPYPYMMIYKIAGSQSNGEFPFQLDQPVLNGSYFFKMISHYKQVYQGLTEKLAGLKGNAASIITTLDDYPGKSRIGDQYARMLFDCAVLHYLDKFGNKDLSSAIEKLFIWAYTPRLYYEVLGMPSIDNYVVTESNLFKKIRDAIHREQIIGMELPLVSQNEQSDKIKPLTDLFIKMNYYSYERN